MEMQDDLLLIVDRQLIINKSWQNPAGTIYYLRGGSNQ